VRTKNKKVNIKKNDYNPARLYRVHKHGMTLNMDELRKKPGLREALSALSEFGEKAIQAEKNNRK